MTEKEKGTVYINAAGALPVLFLDGHQYYVNVAYDYDNNFIEAQQVSDLKDEMIVETVQKIFDKLEENGHKPMLNVTDNTTIESVFENKTMQMVIRRATQPQSNCGGASDIDVHKSPYQPLVMYG